MQNVPCIARLDTSRPEAILVLSILTPPITSTQCILQDMDLSYLLYQIPPSRIILRRGYLPEEYEWGHIALETAGYRLGGVTYRARLSFGFRASSYTARRLPNT